MKPLQISLILFFSFFVFLWMIVFSNSQIAFAESPKSVATRVQHKYDTIQSLTFDFIQDTRGQLSGRPKKGQGQAFFVKTKTNQDVSGQMRWNYFAPDKQVLVSDGIDFSMYFESLNQMIVTSSEALRQDLTYSFFTGSGDVLKDFTILGSDQKDATQDQTAVIKLIPKAKQSQIAEISIWVTNDSLIRRIEILDHFDTLTVLNFSNIKTNTLDVNDEELINKLFNFTPPDGTEIIHQ